MVVNWFSIEIRGAAGKRTYYNSFVTDLPVTPNSVAELAAAHPRSQSRPRSQARKRQPTLI